MLDNYERVLILGADDMTEYGFVKRSIIPLLYSDLCLFVMSNGGVRVLKDRYNRYVTDRVYFDE